MNLTWSFDFLARFIVVTSSQSDRRFSAGSRPLTGRLQVCVDIDQPVYYIGHMTKTDTRESILVAAGALFHSRSYASVGIAAVCARARVSKGSFFHFFPSKRDLAIAVMDLFRGELDQTIIAKSFSRTLPPMERLDCFIRELYAFQKAQAVDLGHVPGCPFGNLALEQATQDEVLRKKVDGCLRSVAKHIQTALSDAVISGEFPPVDTRATAEAMLAYVEGIQLLAKARNDPELIRRLGPALKSIQLFPKR